MSVYKGTRESASWGGTGHDHVITLSEQPKYGSSRIGMRLGNGLEVKRINFPLSGDPEVINDDGYTYTDWGQLISANISNEGAFITGAKAMPGISASLKAIAEDTYSLSFFTDNANPYGNLEYKLLQDNTYPVWEGETATTGTWSTTLTAGAETSDYQLAIRQKSAIFDQPIARHINGKQYEITDHLGNVRVVLSAGLEYNPDVNLFSPRVIATNTYYPFGMLIEPLSGNSEGYRYGFNGMELDNEVKGIGNSLDFGARIYDARIGRWLSIDPLWKKYSEISAYAFSKNNPILFIDGDGMDWLLYTGSKVIYFGGDPGDKTTQIKMYKASSGHKGFQNSKYQNKSNDGPIPVGKYSVNLTLNPERRNEFNEDMTTKLGLGIQVIDWEKAFSERVALHGWGQWRARLTPLKGTDTKGRHSFYLHDSYKGESSGCIEVETDLYYDMVEYGAEGNENIEVWVEYKNNNTSTDGNTEVTPRPWQRYTGETPSGEKVPFAKPNSFPDKKRMPKQKQENED